MKLIFELVAEDVNVSVELAKQRKEVLDNTRALTGLKETGTAAYDALAKKIGEGRAKVRDLTEQQKELNRELKASKVAADSLAGLRLEYGRLIDQITKLTAAERAAAPGKALIKQADAIKGQINSIEQSVGRFTGQVGNYKAGFTALTDLVSGGLATGGIVAAVAAVAKVLKLGTDQAIEFEQGLADLSALTGLTGTGLAGLEDVAVSLETIQVKGVDIVNLGPDILNALKLVGGARPELLDNADALGEVAKNAIVLSKASGDELAPSVEALTTLMGQFNLAASDSGRLINELAAGAKVGASEIPQTTEAIQKFGTVAKTVNVTTGESIALVELLADRQLKGAEAGTQLRNIFSKLASAEILPPAAQNEFAKLGISAKVLADTTLPLQDRLQELAKANGDIAALTKIFGLENLTAATIITAGIPKYEKLKQGIEGTSEAFDQAAIRADTAGVKLDNLKNFTLNTLGDAFLDFGRDINTVIGWFQSLEAQIDKVKQPFVDFFNFIEDGRKKLVAFLGFGPGPNQNPGQDTRTSLDPFAGTKSDTGLLNSKEALDAQLRQVELLKLTAESGNDASNSIGSLRLRVKELKNEIANQTPGSDTFKRLSTDLKTAKKELDAAEIAAGIKKGGKSKDSSVADAKARQAELDAQIKRVNDLRKSIRDLDAETLPNEFDKREIDIQNKRLDALAQVETKRAELEKKIRSQKGVQTEGDETEAALISEETTSIVAAFDEQTKAVQKARAAAQDKQKEQLQTLALEVQALAIDNAERLVEIEVEAADRQTSIAKREAERVRDAKLLALQDELLQGTISRKDYQKQTLAAEEAFSTTVLNLERDRANTSIDLANKLRDAKIEAAKATLAAQLEAIRQSQGRDVADIQATGTAQGIDVSGQVAEREKLGLEQRAKAQQEYAETVKDATQEAQDAQINAGIAVDSADADVHTKKLERIEEEKKKRRELADAAIEVADKIASSVLDIEKNKLDRSQKDATDALEAEYQRRKDAAAGNQVELDKLDKQYAKKREQLEKQQARERQRLAVKEALVAGALAIVKALPNLILAGVAAIATAAQIAVINSQSFARGGMVDFGAKRGVFGGRPHSQGGTQVYASDGSQFEVERDEAWFILKKTASDKIRALSDWNSQFGGAKFGNGGSLAFAPQIALPNDSGGSTAITVKAVAEFSDEQVDRMADRLAERNAQATGNAVAKGLYDANRTLERETDLITYREV